MKTKLIIGLVLILGLYMFLGTVHAFSPEKFWAISIGNIHILDGTSPTGVFQWRGEIVGTDTIHLVDTYVQVGSWRDSFNPTWQPDNRSWFSITNPFEMRVMANSEYDPNGPLWHSIILDPPGMLWVKKPIILGDSWPISSTGMLTAGAAPLGNEVINTPITVTGTVSILSVETITASLGTYRAYKIQHQIEIRDQSNNIIEASTEQDLLVPYLGSVKWTNFLSTELISSLTLPFLFSDVPSNSWAYHYIFGIYDHGITVGCGNPYYCPGENVTRQQMAAFLVRAHEGGPAYEGPCLGPSPFSDVPQSSNFCRNIERLVALGITKGCGDGTTYCPSAPVTREQMAAFIVRAVEGGQFYEGACLGQSPFSDVPQNSNFCRNIERLVARGITLGCGGGNYCPSDKVMRDQMAAFLARAFLGIP